MVSSYMPLRHSVVPTGVSWLSKWQVIKAFHTGVEVRQECVLFLLFFIVYMIGSTNATKMMSLLR